MIPVIDIHSHILPGVDDGAKTEQDSLAMAKLAVKEGITTIIATPHHRNRAFDNYKQEIETSVSILNDLYKENNIPLTVVPGQEVRIYGEIIEDYENGEIQTLSDSKYVLVEFPFGEVPQYTERLFYDMQISGLIPVIAHPERNKELIEDHGRMYELIRNGALAQLTAGSLHGEYGKEIEQFSYELLDANLIHFIASDAHNTTTRGFGLKQAYEKIKNKYGVEAYYSLLENSQLLIDDANVNRYEPSRINRRRKGFFSFLKRNNR